MKKTFITVSLLLILSAIVFSATIIENFTVKTGKDQVVITWKTRDEVNLQEFEIERSSDNITFFAITSIKPKGNNSEYKYTDTTIFKTSVRKFHYRIKTVDNDGSFAYTKSLAAIPKISGIKQTWGSIKAIFK